MDLCRSMRSAGVEPGVISLSMLMMCVGRSPWLVGGRDSLEDGVGDDDCDAGQREPGQEPVIRADQHVIAAVNGTGIAKQGHGYALASRTARITRFSISGILNPL